MSAEGLAQAGLLLGSNIAPETNLPAAVERIRELGTIVAISSVWQSAPAGFVDQPDFCNAAVRLRTRLTREALRGRLRDIEDLLGRVRDPSNKNAPRTIDIDIAVWQPIADEPSGTETDPDVMQRLFVAVPLAEVLPQLSIAGERLVDVATRLGASDGGAARLAVREDICLND